MPFSRATALADRTLARARFYRDLTEINNYYWAGTAATSAVNGKARYLDEDQDYRSKLGLSGAEFNRRLAHNAAGFRSQLSTSDQWHRRASTMVLWSAFDRYLTSVTAVAVASDPTLAAGFPKMFDGLTAMKHGLTLGDRDRTGVLKGPWSKRIASYRNLFDQVPQPLLDNEGELERLRITRNSIAHQFGEPAKSENDSLHSALIRGAAHGLADSELVSVSANRLTKWMGVLEEVVRGIDEHLLNDYIGGFEPAALYIEWARNPAEYEKSLGIGIYKAGVEDSLNAKRFLNGVLGFQGLNKATVTEMIAYIDSL